MPEIANIVRISPTIELQAPSKSKGKEVATILVVEDDTHLREGIRQILELENYRVITTSNGVEALDTLRNVSGTPDLIVSDIMMPQMDGYEFIEAVRAVNQWLVIPFIFLSAKGENVDIRLGKSMGVDDYVTKPFSAADLLVAVSSELARHKELHNAYSNILSQMKRHILVVLQHEFRTPLTSIIGYAGMLTEDGLTPYELEQFLNGVGAGADRLRRLVKNFILLAALERGEIAHAYERRKRPLRDYVRIVELAIKQKVPHTNRSQQHINVEIAEHMLPIMGDEEYVSTALAQLIDNASKFSDDRATIQLKVHMDETGSPCISVTDSGRGIPKDELELIFDAFYQINREQYEDQGAGSGLAIVRGIARIHEADIVVYSVEGKGSTFSLHFPIIHSS